MADRSKALAYLDAKMDRLTTLQKLHVTKFIIHSLLSKITDIDWMDSVDYAVKQVKTQHPAPMAARGARATEPALADPLAVGHG